jgi:hypothetical protein
VLARGACRAETFFDIARFGEKKIALPRRCLSFCDGTPNLLFGCHGVLQSAEAGRYATPTSSAPRLG